MEKRLMKLADKLGFSGFPVVDSENNLAGLITGRDLRFETDLSLKVSELMTSKENLVTVKANAKREEILELMHEHRIEKTNFSNNNKK